MFVFFTCKCGNNCSIASLQSWANVIVIVVKYIWKKRYICTAVVDQSEEWPSQKIFQFKQLERRSLKKSRLQQDSNPWPLRYRCDARPTEPWSHTPGGGGGGTLTKFCTGRLRLEVQSLTLSYTIFAEKVPLLYTFYRKKVPLSHTYFRKSCSSFHVVLNKWTSTTFRGVYSKNYN